ncbi:hypothetical protein SNEBB_005133 [Seison nebaliae]|nr:hypothetical protein SNEBB_005133 [Seison nebaliae]
MATIVDHRAAEIQLILGPMFSGKTTELLRRVKRYSLSKFRTLLVKYEKDCRYDEFNVITHDKNICPDLDTVATSNLQSIMHSLIAADVIGIDEGQFFPDLVSVCESLASIERKIIIVAMLDGTYEREKFGNCLQLIPKAEKVEKLSAICMRCFSEKAAFTQRLTDETSIELIGGTEKYASVCRSCYFLKGEISQPKHRHVSTLIENDENIPLVPMRTLYSSFNRRKSLL